MSDLVKVLKLLCLGLVSAFFIYPFLHEMGHSIFALVSGAKILEVNYFPLPSILCLIDKKDIVAIVLTGLGGLVFPFMIMLIPPPKVFYKWYIWFVVKGICILSFCISIIALVMFTLGVPMQNDDITNILNYAPQYIWGYGVVILFLLLATSIHIIKSKPIKRCLSYFNL